MKLQVSLRFGDGVGPDISKHGCPRSFSEVLRCCLRRVCSVCLMWGSKNLIMSLVGLRLF